MKTSQNEELLRYYRDELTYLRQMGSEFASNYKRVAPRLSLDMNGECADPHVERLLESFAFLTARLRQDLDGEFPEITTALLGVLYPQFVNPVPPMAIARFDADPKQGIPTTGFPIRKNTQLFASTYQGHTCRFRTCYPVTLWPLEVEDAEIVDTGQFSFLDSMTKVISVLRIKLTCSVGTLADLSLKRLRFYLNGDPALASALYEMLFCHVTKVAILPEDDPHPTNLPAGSILPVGFGDDEDVLPYPAQAHPGYRLLQEYFALPEKFHFFDLDNLDRHRGGKSLNLLFMLDYAPDISVNSENFALGCTPVINLFPKKTEPIRLDHRSLEYRLVPDKRHERTTEVHSVLSVFSTSAEDGHTRRFEPFYSYNHAMDGDEHKAFWHARRERSLNRDRPGSEVFLSFHDLDFRPTDLPAQTVYAATLCTNRELATQLPAGARLQTEAPSPLRGISCMTKPTPPAQPPLRGTTLWRLISHLSLNHLSLSEPDSLPALREILKLYSSSDQPATEQQVAGLVGMECRKVVRRVGEDAWRGFCRGTQVTLEFDEDNYVGCSIFLLGTVLSRFLALYASVNSFTQLRIRKRKREGVWEERREGGWKEWPPTAGERIAL
jgi:type VI secretion system protein ImpG